jgi:hypothetical protein
MSRFPMLPILLGVILALGCSESVTPGTDLGQDTSVTDIAVTDIPVAQDVVADSRDTVQTDVEPEVIADVTVDVDLDVITDVPSDVVVIPDVAPGTFPARELPFAYARPAEGDPISEADVTAFTKKVTGLWKKTGWARWILRTSTGVDQSTGKDDYLAWHNDIAAAKADGVVTFSHMGGEHNMWIPGSKVLSEAIGGYLLTGDWEFAKMTEQYCKGLSAVIKGFVWDEEDTNTFLMARAIFPMDQSFTLDETNWQDDGRKKDVIFSTMYKIEDGWNAHTFPWPNNPTWGAEYVTNMRSKDDVRSIVRTTMFLPYVLEDAPDEWVKSACQETWDLMKGFNKDIVDSGYNIRTKDNTGAAYIIPCEDQDLGSYMCYIGMDPTNECCQRISSDLIAYGEQLTEECGNCTGSVYDAYASVVHFYNIPIIWDYHMAAVGNALVNLQAKLAYKLLGGLDDRIDSYMHPTEDEPGHTDSAWNKELAVLLVQTASVGLPLTWFEATHIHKQWTQAVTDYENWPNWDLWAETVADGPVQVRPGATDGGIDIEAITMFLEYCNSPFKNPAGVKFIDCDIVKDPTKWGE